MTSMRATSERVVICLFAFPILLGAITLAQESLGYEGTRAGWLAIFIGGLITAPCLVGNAFRLEQSDTPTALRTDARLSAALSVAFYVLGAVFLGSGGFSS
jgi:hypothetical protein